MNIILQFNKYLLNTNISLNKIIKKFFFFTFLKQKNNELGTQNLSNSWFWKYEYFGTRMNFLWFFVLDLSCVLEFLFFFKNKFWGTLHTKTFSDYAPTDLVHLPVYILFYFVNKKLNINVYLVIPLKHIYQNSMEFRSCGKSYKKLVSFLFQFSAQLVAGSSRGNFSLSIKGKLILIYWLSSFLKHTFSFRNPLLN